MRFFREAQLFGRKALFALSYRIEMCECCILDDVKEASTAFADNDEQVCKRDQIIAPAHCLEVHGVHAAQGDVAYESIYGTMVNVLSISIDIFCT